MAKKPISIDSSNITYDEAIKLIKSIKGSPTIIGEEINELCSVSKLYSDIPTIDFMGGFTRGRINLLVGKPSSGKTTICHQQMGILINDIKKSGQVKFGLYIDVEGSYDKDYSTILGVDQNYMMVKRSSKVIEDCFKEVCELISTGLIAFLVIDSLDAMVARKQDENEFGNTMGSQSGALSMHLPSLYSKIIEYDVTTFLIKQARVKLGYTGGAEVITFSGGYALRHFADNIFIVKRMSNKDLDYTPIQIKAEKTRSYRMGLTLEIPLGPYGVDKLRDLVSISKMVGLIQGSNWLSFVDKDGNEYRENGAAKFLALMRENPEIVQKLKEQFYSKYVENNSLKIEGVEELNVEFEQE